MKKKKSRIDIPGFSYGRKTGEFVDVPKIFGGKPQPKKSGRPHSVEELLGFQGHVSRKRKAAVLYTKIGKDDYTRRKRTRSRLEHAPITNNALPQVCNRRFFEWTGDKVAWMDYVEKPELWSYRPKTAFEVTDGLMPMMTFTSAREALIMCATLAQYGIAACFNRIVVPR